MRKSGIFMILISILFIFFVNEYYRYDGYKDIEIPGIGIAKVPEEWYCSTNEDGLLYFANMPIQNKGCKVYFIQHSIDSELLQNEDLNEKSGYYLEDSYLGDVLSIEKIFVSPYGDTCTFSNGSSYRACTFYLNGTKVDSYYINFTNNKTNSIFFIVDDSIDLKTMEDMTKWFENSK